MKRIHKLEVPIDELRREADPAQFDFDTTEQLPPLDGTIGQERATAALEFGVDIGNEGYNVYVAGSTGTRKSATAEAFLKKAAGGRPVPPDWLYIYNFKNAYEPRAISLPPGQGRQLTADMDEFIEEVKEELPRAFESEDYERRKSEITADIQKRREALSEQIQERAKQEGFSLQTTPLGVITIPLSEGEPMSREAFDQLPEEQKEEIQNRSQQLQTDMSQTMAKVRKLEKEAVDRIHDLDKEVALSALGHMLDDLHQKYDQFPEVKDFLVQIQDDIIERLEDLRSPDKEGQAAIPGLGRLMQEDQYDRYKVNLLVDNSELQGAPVIVENNPTYYNLVGRIDYRARLGGMTTDFTMIKPGALQKANGGYLLLQAYDVLTSIQSWDALKKTIRAGQVRIENLGEQYSALPTAMLKPEPIPVNLKVVMVGLPYIYYLLYNMDEDFRKLFKVRSDFDVQMDRDDQHVRNYAQFIASQVVEQGLRHFDRTGVAKVVEYGSRLEEHQGKLSTRFLDVGDLLAEANYWAGKEGAQYVRGQDVQKAIDQKIYRSNLMEKRVQEMIAEGTLMISTQGTVPGQINGLSVQSLGDYAFGRPSRITARTFFGQNGVTDIERETKMSGRIHSKGVLVLSGYLAGKYAQDRPLSLSASLTFEQMYDEVDGDSASSTELYALLSSLAGLPLRQDMAVTGSVNQRGEIQPIGGVNEKIEGFFEVCKAAGLTGEQGVMIPESNRKHLMLRDEVVQAVKDGRFHIYAVKTIDEGIELLTGRQAGKIRPDGTYPIGTVNNLVDQRLREYAERAKEFAGAMPEHRPAVGPEREAA